jgi:predicted anti-sigma-YlaC factor YlaD
MDCLETLNQICEALEEDINSPLCKEVEDHLKNCPKCCAQVDSIRKVVRLYQRVGDLDVPEPVDERLWKVLNLQRPESH